MDKKIINDALSVSGQISLDDIHALKNSGVKSIVCNRPDNEDPGQLSHSDIEAMATENGLSFHFMPVISGQVSIADGEAFGDLLDSLVQPTHAYCRSGTRCTTLWAIAELKKGVDREEIIKRAASAGYDLSKTI